MQLSEHPSPLIVIVGPTAVGKTELAIELAEKLNGEIISADSRLFYRGMNIGTAKPSETQRNRIPHHLIDIAEPDEIWSLALFQKAAQQAINSIHSQGKIPFLVGGTGQYIWSVIQDWKIPIQKPDDRLRRILEDLGKQIGPLELHRRLSIIDPDAAESIEPHNLRRTVRALEVILHTGYRFSSQRLRGWAPYSIKILGFTRSRIELYRRIDDRIDTMFDNGLVEEVRTLMEKGYSPALPTLSAISYREAAAVIQEKMSIEEAKVLVKRMTRQFVRRQANWFKESDPIIHWFDVSRISVDEIATYIGSVEGWIKNNSFMSESQKSEDFDD